MPVIADSALVRAALSEPETAGYADLFAAAPPSLVSEWGIAQAEIAGVACVRVDALPGVRLLNHAMRADAFAPSGPALAAAISFWHDRGRPALIASINRPEPPGRPDDARREHAWVKFTRDCTPARVFASSLAVRHLPRDHAEQAGGLVATAFDLPDALGPWLGRLVGRRNWNWFGAFEREDLVAVGALFAHGATGWLTLAATAARARGRGAQKALLAARIEHARSTGLRRLVTETGEVTAGRPDASHRNIERAGFAAAFTRPIWRLDPPYRERGKGGGE